MLAVLPIIHIPENTEACHLSGFPLQMILVSQLGPIRCPRTKLKSGDCVWNYKMRLLGNASMPSMLFLESANMLRMSMNISSISKIISNDFLTLKPIFRSITLTENGITRGTLVDFKIRDDGPLIDTNKFFMRCFKPWYK